MIDESSVYQRVRSANFFIYKMANPYWWLNTATTSTLLRHLENASAKSIEDVDLSTGIPHQYNYDPTTGTFTLLPK